MPHFHRSHRSYLQPGFNVYYAAAHGIVLILTVVAYYLTQFSDGKNINPAPAPKKTAGNSRVELKRFLVYTFPGAAQVTFRAPTALK